MNNLELTQEIFVRFGNGDVDGIVELLHEDAVVEFYGTEEIPYARTWTGNAQCRRFFETVLSSVNIHVFEAEDFICQDDKVIVVGRLHLTVKANGGEIISPFVHVIDCKDGRWIRFRDFMNTAVAREAFIGNAS